MATPLMIFGHLYPIQRMIGFEKERLINYHAAIDARILPANLEEVRLQPGSQSKLRIEEAKQNKKLFEQAQRIPTLPLNLNKLLILALPPAVDLAIKLLIKG